MQMWMELVGGGVLLYFGAEWFVGGASALALALGIPEILIGLTVVAYGTSAPEIIVGVEAALAGHGGVALGNVIGSNVANIGLILGVAALISPARVDGSMRRRELPILLLATASVPVLLADGMVSRIEAGGLLIFAVAYTGWMIHAARAAVSMSALRQSARVAAESADAAGATKPQGRKRALIAAAVGLCALLVGGSLFVGGAVSVARSFGLSERLVGLTIVAIGTSLPELVTSVIAALRGHSDLAVGNVVGSNIFNVLLCLGAAAFAHPLAAPLHTVSIELAALMIVTIVAAIFIRTERVISRGEGAVAVALYATFLAISLLLAEHHSS